MPLILPANTLSTGGYTVANSCRFDRASSIKLERTPGSAGNRRTFTFSCWFKLGNSASSQSDYYQIFGGFDGTGNEGLFITDADHFYLFMEGTNALISNLKLRDVSSWYHVIMAVDTTNGTADNRCRLYLNGSEITSFSARDNPTQNYDSGVNNTSVQNIGERLDDDYFDGYMAEVVLIDGLQLTPTSFGEFDEDSPTIWKPKDVSGLTFGTNGFYLSFSDSADLGADSSGNSNDFTATNLAATDQATDTPTNNFATFNPLVPQTITFAEGNTEASASGTSWKSCFSTIGFSSGKWYFETTINSLQFVQPGIMNAEQVLGSEQLFMDSSGGYSYHQDGAKGNNASSTAGYGDTFTTGDILSVAFDADNGTIWFAKNGTWQNSATEGEIEAGTTTNAAFSGIDTTKQYLFAMSLYNDCNISANFGSPAIAITSGNADGNGYGNFEYAVPSGYYALCTKNLAEYG